MRSLFILLVVLAAASPRVAVAQALDPDEEAARRHFERGLTHYDAGEYQAALDEFDAVKRFHDSPALDYNIARCYDRLERYQEAVTYYERYVSQKPDAADAAATRERIATLRARLAPPAAAPRPAPPSETPRPAPTVAPAPAPAPAAAPAAAVTTPAAAPVDNGAPPRSPIRRWAAPIAIGAGALVTAAIGAGLLGSVKGDYDAALGPSGCRPCSNDQIAPMERRADAGYALLGVGGALVVVDVALIAVMAARGKKSGGAHAQLERRWQ
jgi:tetratricopeptide (TPR) repeat protein